MVFHPKGFLVAILTDTDEVERAAAALRAVGFADRRLRVFSSEQILDDHSRYTAQQSLTRRLVAALIDDRETLDLCHGHARHGRAALWVHVAGDDEADRAIRGLAGNATRRCTSGTTGAANRATSTCNGRPPDFSEPMTAPPPGVGR